VPRETSRLGGLQLVNPHRAPGAALAAAFAVVPAGSALAATALEGTSTPLRVEIAGAGRLWDLDAWNAETHGTSLLVAVRGRTVHEWYADGTGAHDLFLGASMTKSALAHLVGLAVARGTLAVDDPVVRLVPELRGTGYDGCTVLDVATMTSGVDWVEDHRDPTGPASRLTACFGDPGGDSRALLTTLGGRGGPGSRWEYCTADSQVLDWVRERATGTTYVEALAELWQLLGCADDAVVGTDAVGVPMAGGSLAATARDWTRLAMLQVDGTVGAARLLDGDWVERSCRPSRSFTRPGRLPSSITTHAGFGAHWWPLDDDGRRVTADGSRGQFAYVDRDLDVVVVKTSRWPYEDFLVDRQLRDLSYLGLPEIAAAAVTAAAEAEGPSA
jgi:CubicO group peptidase (beta-lactamase class C family)